MLRLLATLVAPLLDLPLIRRVRRNHGLEHATIHVLSRKVKGLIMAGRSTSGGFYLYGDVATPDVEAAVREALARMRSGEAALAIHPNCGTGLVTAGLLTSVAGMLGMAGARNSLSDRLSRLPSVVLFSTLALILAQPLGLALQQHFTTLGDPGATEIVDITRSELLIPVAGRRLTVHYVRTRSG